MDQILTRFHTTKEMFRVITHLMYRECKYNLTKTNSIF
jgi:hypothetical protein